MSRFLGERRRREKDGSRERRPGPMQEERKRKRVNGTRLTRVAEEESV